MAQFSTTMSSFTGIVSDYKTLGHYSNRTFKYADDFTFVGYWKHWRFYWKWDCTWSQNNKLNINLNKCKELIFKRPNLKHEIYIFTLFCIELVDSAKLLGVFVDRALSFHEHVEHIAKTCNQRFYLLQQMRKQGLNADCLKILKITKWL